MERNTIPPLSRRARNLERSLLEKALHAYDCPRCHQSSPEIYATRKPVRFVRCRHCACDGKIVVTLPRLERKTACTA